MELDLAELKKVGTLQQKQKEYFILRLRLVAGDAGAHFLETVARVAREYGRGETHLTTRQGIEIPWIPAEKVVEARRALTDAGLKMGACGPRVRVVVGCPGSQICKWGVIDTKEISQKLDQAHFGREMPHKFKFAVTGCPHNCAKATENDLGIMGGILPRWNKTSCTSCDLCLTVCPTKAIFKTPEGAYSFDAAKCIYCTICTSSCPQNSWEREAEGSILWIGGTMGKIPRLATKLTGLIQDQNQLYALVDKTLKFFAEKGKKRERFGHTLDRVGLEEAQKEILHG